VLLPIRFISNQGNTEGPRNCFIIERAKCGVDGNYLWVAVSIFTGAAKAEVD
jgi:hypothetical protein